MLSAVRGGTRSAAAHRAAPRTARPAHRAAPRTAAPRTAARHPPWAVLLSVTKHEGAGQHVPPDGGFLPREGRPRG